MQNALKHLNTIFQQSWWSSQCFGKVYERNMRRSLRLGINAMLDEYNVRDNIYFVASDFCNLQYCEQNGQGHMLGWPGLQGRRALNLARVSIQI